MANIANPYCYFNMISLTREEAAVTLTCLLSMLSSLSDEDAKNMAQAVGLQGDFKELIESVGSRLDVNWEEMKQKSLELA